MMFVRVRVWLADRGIGQYPIPRRRRVEALGVPIGPLTGLGLALLLTCALALFSVLTAGALGALGLFLWAAATS